MRIYWDKLAHVQVVINCQYLIAQMCTSEDALPHNLGTLCIDDVMSYNSFTSQHSGDPNLPECENNAEAALHFCPF